MCRRSHGVRGATNRILRRWRRSKTKPNKARREEERTKGSLSFMEIARPHRDAYEDERIACISFSLSFLSFSMRAYACSLPLAHYDSRDRVSLAAGTFSRFFSAARWSLTPRPCPPGPTRPRPLSCSRILRIAPHRTTDSADLKVSVVLAAPRYIPLRTLFKTANRECRYTDTATGHVVSRRAARAAIISIRDY